MPPAIIGGIITGVGGIIGSVVGGKKTQGKVNQATNFLASSEGVGDFLGTGQEASNSLASLLGLGPNPQGSDEALNNFFQSSGGQFILDRGSEAITTNQAAKGLLNSGDTLKGLTEFGQQTGSTFFQNFLNNLGVLSQQGLQAGGIVAEAAIPAAANSANVSADTRKGILEGAGSIIGSIFRKG